MKKSVSAVYLLVIDNVWWNCASKVKAEAQDSKLMPIVGYYPIFHKVRQHATVSSLSWLLTIEVIVLSVFLKWVTVAKFPIVRERRLGKVLGNSDVKKSLAWYLPVFQGYCWNAIRDSDRLSNSCQK